MMRAKPRGSTFLDAMKDTSPSPTTPAAVAAAKEALKEDEWEVRPGGMLVQKRGPDADAPAAPVPTIRVKVKHNGVTHEIYISAEASFGELKKMMSAKTGLHHEDQKLVYKDRERDSKTFLDMAGVKDKSKMVLLEDPDAQAKRLLEQRRADKAGRAAKHISRVSLDVDKLATKVTALEAIVGKGGRVVEADVVALTEALMTELVKLDAIAAEGEVKAQRRMQEKRVQKYVETLDVIRAKNAAAATATAPKSNGNGNGKVDRSLHLPPRPPPVSQRRQFNKQQQPAAPAAGKAAAVAPTASWETFDLLSSMPSTSSATATTTMAAATTTTKNASGSPIPRFDWELF
ncbi:BAG family molecular chaperone regulator 1-like [Lolium rigidum]|uniref:BAG family molecular chaperone regulator 1-like n=1 Tax=Lolium rigidum TaxID=89674 RepID=UPI001F5D4398|nr:BAG family molecular chaperone regulator 1-like [Lolium rigidum]